MLSPVLGARVEVLFWGVCFGFALLTVSEMKSQVLGVKKETCVCLSFIHFVYMMRAYAVLYALTNFPLTAQLNSSNREDLGVLL